MVSFYLPEEILTEIFLWLPTKSVGRFRSLSKRWCANLSTSEFINLHLSRKTRQDHLILVSQEGSLRTINPPIIDNTVSKKLELQYTFSGVIGSCNGLVLLKIGEPGMLVVNPTTLQHIEVPDLIHQSMNVSSFRYGFGYDSSTDDYKIVAISYRNTGPECFDRSIHVYSVKLGAWKWVNNSSGHTIIKNDNGAYTNGAIHWLSCSMKNGCPHAIVSFDLAYEVIREFPAPIKKGHVDHHDPDFFVHNGCLYIFDCSGTVVDIWKLKVYGFQDSWTKYRDTTGLDLCLVVPVCFIGAMEIVQFFDGALIVYNLKDGTSKSMVIDGVHASFLAGITFVDSLVSPNQQGCNSS